MAKKKITEPADDLAGTVEGQAAEFFEREKAYYEERTGQRVKFEPPVPTTRTAMKEKAEAPEPPAEETTGETPEGDQE